MFSIGLRAGLLILTAFLSALLYNLINPEGIDLLTPYCRIRVGERYQKVPLFQKSRITKDITGSGSIPVPVEFSIEDLEPLTTVNQAVIIDTRSREEYCQGHIPGAISIPFTEFNAGRVDLTSLGTDLQLVTYCEGASCQQSLDVAVQLSLLGYDNVAFYIGGWEEWLSRGKPIVKGCRP